MVQKSSMNKITQFALIAVLVVGFGSSVHAVEILPAGNGNPGSVMQVWGSTGDNTSIFKAGESVTNEAGFVEACPSWYPKMGCANITKTNYYRNSQIEVARQLTANNSLSRFPSFSYWAKFVK